MDPVSAIGLSGLGLIWIGALVYAARAEADHHRAPRGAENGAHEARHDLRPRVDHGVTVALAVDEERERVAPADRVLEVGDEPDRRDRQRKPNGELERERLASERAGARKSMVGSGDRSERIRTYNFPQGRVTDHRINLTLHRLPEILEGQLDELIGAVQDGFLVTRFHYVNVLDRPTTLLTGMTRDGVFRISDGEIAEPVHNFRFAQSVLEAFSSATAIGAEVTAFAPESGSFGSAVAPALHVGEFAFASTTSH